MFFDVILPAMRRRRGGNFRKRLGVYTYKVNTPHSHKKPGVIPLNIKQSLIKLRPYVSVHTTQVEDEVRARIKALNDYTNPANFGRYSETLPTTNTETKETKTK